MGEKYDQGRFGPPPAAAFSVAAMRWPDGHWSVTVSLRREGQAFERTYRGEDLSLADLVEAIVTETYALRQTV